MTNFYEILIRGDGNGAVLGSHIIEQSNGVPRAIKDGDWPAVAASVDAAAIGTIEALKAQLASAQKDKDSALVALAANAVKESQTIVAEKDAEIYNANAARDSLAAELSALKTFAASLLDQARKIDHPEVAALVAEADKPENLRKKDAIAAQIAELQKQADEIPA